MGKSNQIVVLIGPPGAGKGTQADLLVEDFGFYHLETSKIIEEKFKAASTDDGVMNKQKALYASGKLTSPELVRTWVIDKMRELASQGKSIVFSGSFRTLSESEKEIPVAEEIFGRENIHVIHINVSEAESIERNTHRRICKANRHPIPNFPEFKDITVCPKDGSELIKRTLDTTETMKVRYATYLQETAPVLDYFAQQAYGVIEINGEEGIRKVHNDIITGIHKTMHPDLLQKLMQ